MARIKLRFVQGFVAHGKPYYYFRKPGCARIALPGSPFSEEFMTTYRMALAADAPPRHRCQTQRARHCCRAGGGLCQLGQIP
jgi:hypothetical protein